MGIDFIIWEHWEIKAGLSWDYLKADFGWKINSEYFEGFFSRCAFNSFTFINLNIWEINK